MKKYEKFNELWIGNRIFTMKIPNLICPYRHRPQVLICSGHQQIELVEHVSVAMSGGAPGTCYCFGFTGFYVPVDTSFDSIDLQITQPILPAPVI